jgi:hypothetical protein
VLKEANTIYTSDNPYALNVVYFVPKDLRFLPDYENRISAILIRVKEFYDREMTRLGYPNNKMGLMVDSNNNVKITSIRAKHNKDHYHYDLPEAVDNVQAELNEHFQKNPREKFSEYSLIIMPSEFNADGEPGWAPFFGQTPLSFALDYPDMSVDDLGAEGRRGDLATKWIGGLAHELGHGLGIEHDAGQASEIRQFGMSMMNGGNSTFGSEATFLSHASGAILNTSQVFQREKVKYKARQEPQQFKLLHSKIEYLADQGVIQLTGKIASDMAWGEVIAFFNPADLDEKGNLLPLPQALEVNRDYTQVGFVSTVDSKGNFTVRAPLRELNDTKVRNDVSLSFPLKSGFTQNEYISSLEMKNGQPTFRKF